MKHCRVMSREKSFLSEESANVFLVGRRACVPKWQDRLQVDKVEKKLAAVVLQMLCRTVSEVDRYGAGGGLCVMARSAG